MKDKKVVKYVLNFIEFEKDYSYSQYKKLYIKNISLIKWVNYTINIDTYTK